MRILSVELKQKLNLLHTNEYFEGLDEGLLKPVTAHMQLREYERGEALFWEGRGMLVPACTSSSSVL